MNKKILIGLGALVIAIIGITALSVNRSSHFEELTTGKKILGLNFTDGVKCIQMNKVGKDTTITNTMYFYKNQMRYDSEFDAEVQGQKDMHVISDGKKSYIWGKGAPVSALGGNELTGVIIDVTDDEGMVKPPVSLEEIKSSGTTGIPGLDCVAWSPDMKIFELPKDIKFTTMDDMMNPENMMKNAMNTHGIDNLGEVDCSVCYTIPDEISKKDCLDSIGCE